MDEFTDKNEQAFLDACGAIGVEPNATVNKQKERYLVSEYLKHPVSWLPSFVMVGLPYFLSRMTLRPDGPRVALTALAKLSSRTRTKIWSSVGPRGRFQDLLCRR